MSLCCIYHKTQPFRVVEDEVANDMVATGEWFRHPNDVNKQKELPHEKSIRRKPKQRSSDGEDSPKSL